MDSEIIKFAYPRLKAFAEQHKMGYPIAFISPPREWEEWDSYQALSPEDKDKKYNKDIKAWDTALEKMVWSLGHYIEAYGFVGWNSETDKWDEDLEKKFYEGWELFTKNFFSLWD